jgi:hypothetical protein
MKGTRGGRVAGVMLATWLAGTGVALGQEPRPLAVEGAVGWAGFVDDATQHHAVFGIGVRVPLGERLSVGPEVVGMIGPATDRDLFVLGSLWLDLGPSPVTARVVPFVVAGGGYMRHSDRFANGRYAHGEGSFTAGGGVRARLTDRIHVGGDVRLGWELHLRAVGFVGVTWPRR